MIGFKLFEIPILLRNISSVVSALVSPRRPFLAQIVPMRKCNLACTYCNEFDHTSEPVPLDEVKRWIDKLAELGTSHVTVSGGEPLLHPQLNQIIAHVRKRKMIAGVITNGFYLSQLRIEQLNRAGLEFLQISIDNVNQDSVSKKSLSTLDEKLQCLAQSARFRVNINSVVGTGKQRPEDALTIARRARTLGFVSTIGVAHDANGQLKSLNQNERSVLGEVFNKARGNMLRRFINPLGWRCLNKFQQNLIEGKPNKWRCRAGARYLYICERGSVQRCSQFRTTPNIPLSRYTLDDFDREYYSEKSCASNCTISCVQRTALLDNWRGRQVPDVSE